MKRKPLDPSLFNLMALLSIAAHFVYPLQDLVHAPIRYIGIGIIFLGLAINFRAVGQLRKMHTSVEFDKTPSRLVTDKLFRFSRNPIYLGGVMVLLGIAIFLGSLIAFLFPVILFLILDRIYIPLEERRLEARFGVDYLAYKQIVRRWL